MYWLVGAEGIEKIWNNLLSTITNFGSNAVGFISNLQANLEILVDWIKGNWHVAIANMGLAFIAVHVNMIKNVQVMLKTAARLWVAFQGFLVSLFERLFTVEFQAWLMKGLVRAGQALVDFTARAALQLASIFTGCLLYTSPSPRD